MKSVLGNRQTDRFVSNPFLLHTSGRIYQRQVQGYAGRLILVDIYIIRELRVLSKSFLAYYDGDS